MRIEYKNRDWLYEHYITKRYSQGDIAKSCGVCQNTIRHWMTKFKIPFRGKEIYHTAEFKEKQRIAHRGARNHAWRGGRVLGPRGYVFIKALQHPMTDYRGYVLEHRLVMAAALGRSLDSNELVHHENGNRADNRLDNLRIVSRKEHPTLHQLEKRTA
jgi:hypothetical protein